jgi:hypothetical protein
MKTQTGLDFELMGNIVHKKKRKKNSTRGKYRGKKYDGVASKFSESVYRGCPLSMA